MSQQSVRQAARRSALDAQGARRKERADRERSLEGLAVEVLTALGERDGAVRDSERRPGEALRTMTETRACPSVRRSSGVVAASHREISRLRRLDGGQQDGAPRATRRMSAAGLDAPRRDVADDPDIVERLGRPVVRRSVVAWCRNNMEERLAMKLRWIDSKGVNNHPEAALASLAKLEAVQTTWVLPVHGAPWRGDAE